MLAKLQNPVLAAAECASALSLPSTNPRQPSSSVLVELLRSQQERIAVEKAQNAAKKAPTAGGRTVVQPLVAQAGTENKAVSELAAAVPPDALQGIPLSGQEREDIAAGLTSAMARRAAEARVDTLEWLLGLERADDAGAGGARRQLQKDGCCPNQRTREKALSRQPWHSKVSA